MLEAPNEKPGPSGGPFWLRRADQTAVALLVAAALLGTVFWWWTHDGPRGGLVEVEQAERIPVRFTVDVNTADWPELTLLPRIGETLSQRIIDSRETEGPFSSIDDLQRVKGIGPRTIEQLRPYIEFPSPHVIP
ncbi:MAG: helix-hairpin-helix domain-containing protein [Pirellulaceae bacterium]|nr:helix-hairpin-helix domain-containing protein [Pirellulaceae bacterium]